MAPSAAPPHTARCYPMKTHAQKEELRRVLTGFVTGGATASTATATTAAASPTGATAPTPTAVAATLTVLGLGTLAKERRGVPPPLCGCGQASPGACGGQG